MKRKIIRIIKKNWIMAIVFIIISIFSFQIVTPIIDLTITNKEGNRIFTDKVENFWIEKKEVSQFEKKVIEALMNIDEVIIRNSLPYSDEGFETYGIYFNSSINREYKMKEGRFFSKEDFVENKNYAVVGENVYAKLKSKETIVYNGVEFKILGVIDSSDSKKVMDDKLLINLSYLISADSLEGLQLGYSIDSINGSVEDKVEVALNDQFKEYGKVSYHIFSDNENGSALMKSLDTYKFFLILLLIVIIILIISVINITSLWIDNDRIELGVRKLLGGTNKKIILKIFIRYESTGILATIIGFIITKTIDTYNFIPIELGQVSIISNYFSLGVVISLIFIIGVIVSIYSSMKILKLDINGIIKE